LGISKDMIFRLKIRIT